MMKELRIQSVQCGKPNLFRVFRTGRVPGRLMVTGVLLCALSCGGGEDPAGSGENSAGGGEPSAEPGIVVTLQPAQPDSTTNRSLRWSPYGKQLPLTAGEGGLVTQLSLGPQGARPMDIRMSKSQGAQYFDRLSMDLNRDGTFETGETFETTPSETRGRFWSSFSAVVDIPITDPNTGELDTNPYPMSLWYVEDPRVQDQDPVLRFSRRGWMEGRVSVDGVETVVMVTENSMDGVFDRADSWALASADSADAVLQAGSARSLEEHAWLHEAAYRVSEIDPSGRRIVLLPFDPGITRAAEAEMNDHLKVDREAPRSGGSVAFLHDFAEAESSARQEGKALFVDFETTWCGPCKLMDQWVYTADPVMAAAQNIIAVKVDGDERLDLKDRFAVEGFPTMILLDPQGKEMRRLTGYVKVEDMTSFLNEAR